MQLLHAIILEFGRSLLLLSTGIRVQDLQV